ncbi:MAG: LPXTG cell wall anchor domain-containing protein [Clostridiales bacterium]|nr:LPXTG cell wall anchor domain-containing protein [Clostridiales bacterium]
MSPINSSLVKGFRFWYDIKNIEFRQKDRECRTRILSALPGFIIRDHSGGNAVWNRKRAGSCWGPTAAPTAAPTATPKPVPKTGDSANPALWIGLIVLGVLCIGLAVHKFRK